MKRYFFLLLFFAGACSTNTSDYKPVVQNPEFLHRSIKAITDRIVHDIFSPPVASRIYTYSCVAGYEAIIAGNPKYISLSGQLNGLEPTPKPDPDLEYCFELASIQATLQVGRQLIFSESDLDEFYNQVMSEFKSSGMPGDVFERSIEYGKKVAEHVLAWSSKDSYKQTRSFPKYTILLDDPGTWKPTPPAYMDAIEPHWNKIRPFAIDSATQFKPKPPTTFSIQKNSQFYQEALEVYNTGKGLTEEQRSIASFWDCNPFVMNVRGHVMFATKKISPGGHWMNITRVTCTQKKADFAASAEAYVRVAISLIDGFISCWDEKYRSKVIRPETYINQYIDENWTPLLQTPPFPEYTSGHSVISSSAAVALTDLFGDNFAFTDSTELEFGLTARSFKSFKEASEEAAVSRLYGGIHYRPAIDQGIVEGRALGEWIVGNIKTRKEDNPVAEK
jgi:hypothetical protein